ncbi:MAG: alanine racemase [Elusimicrobia bacterium]|nr:alanine racemase [Candidatus Liberimonas magnetica]
MSWTCSWKPSNDHIYRPTWIEISGSVFQNNLKSIFSCLKPKTKLLAVVKANAYGHLSAPLSKIALQNGVYALGVSSIEEGIALRQNGIKGKILVLGSIYPLSNFAVTSKYGLIPTISSQLSLHELASTARKLKKRLPFHLKVDTGMGRIGISPKNAVKLLDEIASAKNVSLEGIYTHFSVAGTNQKYTLKQLNSFKAVLKYAKKLGFNFIAHSANSSALLRNRAFHLDMARPGLLLYGMYPFKGARKLIKLSQVLSWKTKVVFLKRVPKGTAISYSRTYITKRNSVIATLPVGYADGYLRKFSNKADVLIRGQRCRVVGRVTMDMIMVDVTVVKGAGIGDEVVLIGSQGKEKIRPEELANIAGTINYEITCGISYRVPRILI